MRIRIIFIISIVFQLSPLQAQQLIFENISDKLGLPSKECYNVMQDSRGCIWISTDAGLCRYDGNTLEIFDKNNGIPESSCYIVMEDPEGTIWIGTSARRILSYKNNQLIESPLSKLMSRNLFPTDSISATLQFIYAIKSIGKDQLYISTPFYSFLGYPRSGELDQLIEKDTVADFYFRKKNSQWFNIKRGHIDGKENLKHAKQGFIVLKLNMDDSDFYIKVPVKDGYFPHWRVLTTMNKKGELFISLDSTLVYIDKNNKYKIFRVANRIIALYCDKADGLWVGTYKNGGYYYPDPPTFDLPIAILPDYSLSGISEDHEGGIWCTTLEKGIFYSRNKNIITYKNIPGLDIKAEMLKVLDEKIYISSIPGKFWVLEKNGSIQNQIELGINHVIGDICQYERTTYISGAQFIKKIDEQGRGTFLNSPPTYLSAGAICLVKGPKNRLYLISPGRNVQEIIDGLIQPPIPPYLGIGITLFYSIKENKLWMGSKNGVYMVNQQDLSLTKIPGISGTVVKIIPLKSGPLCFLTKESGLYLYKKGEIIRMDEKLKLPKSIFYDIQEDAKNQIWIATNKGLIKITNNLSPSIQVYNISNGLPANIINGIVTTDDYIFVSTEEGISRFRLDMDLHNYTPPYISLGQFKINDRDTTYQEGMVLSNDENSITMTFHLPTYKEPGNTVFLYILEGGEEKTELVKGNKLILNRLSPGNYRLMVYGVNNDGVKSRVPLILHFEIKKPFWANPWSIFFACVLFLLTVYIIIGIITKNIKVKEKKKTALHKQISEFQLNAIQAQMNPHFIFNAINSIQHYILSHETQAAYDYLAKFSKLIRLVLANSQQSVISLSKEIETLELYLELEQRRFRDKFSFSIHVGQQVETREIKIPVMLIQPFVENAIWHGIMNLEEAKKGDLLIDISLENDFLKIVIEDNGVGREKARAMKMQSDHTSMGTLLVEKRLDLLKKVTHQDQSIIITDLYNAQGDASGTKVEIFLPHG